MNRRAAFLLALAPMAVAAPARAGPPYVTDDPEPVALGHWEVYLATQSSFTAQGGAGTLPHVEVNHGAVPEVQLHAIVPLAFVEAAGVRAYGPGDVELGVKWRFIEESPWIPQVGTFPLLEVPIGSEARGLGAGAFQVLLPLWLQKSFGPWTTYGGGGRWFKLGGDHADWWFAGGMLQRRFSDHLTLGSELFYESAAGAQGAAELRFNVGAIWDVTPHHHVLLSAGRAIIGPTVFQDYLAYQLTY